MRFRSKLEGGEDSSQFESNPDLVHHPFHRRILACNVTCSLWGQLFRNWTGERGQTPFQPRTPYIIYIFQLNPTPLDRQFICIVYKLYIYFVLLSLLYDNNCIIILFYYYLIVYLFLFIIQNYYTIIIFFFPLREYTDENFDIWRMKYL